MFQFDQVFCISLDRHPHRWARFESKLPSDWPFRRPERYAAVDGQQILVPDWWTSGSPAYGCYQSHLKVLEHCIENGIESCLILEDDAVCREGFTEAAIKYISALPSDWELIYLGGQHLSMRLAPPVRVNPDVYIPYNVNRTHAYAVRGISAMRRIVWHLKNKQQWQRGHHIDHHMGTLVQERQFPVYCPARWLFGQDDGRSSIAGSHRNRTFFNDAADQQKTSSDFVMVMGSMFTNVHAPVNQLIKARAFLGPWFVQRSSNLNTRSMQRTSTAINVDLNHIFQRYLPYPSTEVFSWGGSLRCELDRWLKYMTAMADRDRTIAAGYAPQFSFCGPIMESLLGSRLKVIYVQSSIESQVEESQRQLPLLQPEARKRLGQYIRLWQQVTDRFLQVTQASVIHLSTDSKVDEARGIGHDQQPIC